MGARCRCAQPLWPQGHCRVFEGGASDLCGEVVVVPRLPARVLHRGANVPCSSDCTTNAMSIIPSFHSWSTPSFHFGGGGHTRYSARVRVAYAIYAANAMKVCCRRACMSAPPGGGVGWLGGVHVRGGPFRVERGEELVEEARVVEDEHVCHLAEAWGGWRRHPTWCERCVQL